MARQNGHDQAQVWSRHGQSTVLLRMGRIEEAASLLEGSPALSLDSAQTADTILGLGLLAVARLRLGKRAAARKAAEETLRQLERTRPMANFNLEGYSGAVEVLLALWDASLRESAGRSRDLEQLAPRACGALRAFARVFPIARPRDRLWRGMILRLSGHPSRAGAVVERGLGVGRAPPHALRAGAPPSRDRPARRSWRRLRYRPPRMRRRDLNPTRRGQRPGPSGGDQGSSPPPFRHGWRRHDRRLIPAERASA